MSTSKKVNDLTNSKFRKRFFDKGFVPETTFTIRSLRVSTKKQEQGRSYQDQEEITREYCKKNNLEIVDTFKVAETASNHNLRKYFHQMIEMVTASQHSSAPIKHLVFSHQSRSNRNKKSARQLEELLELGVTLHFARDGRKLDPNSDISEWLMWLLDNIKNERQSEENTQNAMGGIVRCIEDGRYPGSKPPFGYKAVGRKNKRHFVLDGVRTDYMRTAFEIVASPRFEEEKLSDARLKKKLDDMFPQLDYTPHEKRFCELLRDPFYTGEEFKWAGEVYKAAPASQATLVEKDVWLRVQDVLNGRSRSRRLSKAHPYIGMMNCNGKLLDENGKLTDEICGCAITAERIRKANGRHFDYYRCANNAKNRKCSQRDRQYMSDMIGRSVSYRESEVEEIFSDMFSSFSFDEVTCQRMTKYLWDEHFRAKKSSTLRLEQLYAAHKELNRKLDTAYEDKLNGNLDDSRWLQMRTRWESEKLAISQEMKALEDSKDEYMQRGVTLIELMQHAEIIFKSATPEKKRRMVELVSSNRLLKDGTLEYDWKKPFDMLAVRGDLKKWRTRMDSNHRPHDS